MGFFSGLRVRSSNKSSGNVANGLGTIKDKYTSPLFEAPESNQGLSMFRSEMSKGIPEAFSQDMLQGMKARSDNSIEGGLQAAISNMGASFGDTSGAAFQVSKARMTASAGAQSGAARSSIDVMDAEMRMQQQAAHRMQLAQLTSVEAGVLRDAQNFKLGVAGVGVQQAQLSLQANAESFRQKSFGDDLKLKNAALIGKYPGLVDYLIGEDAADMFFTRTGGGNLTYKGGQGGLNPIGSY